MKGPFPPDALCERVCDQYNERDRIDRWVRFPEARCPATAPSGTPGKGSIDGTVVDGPTGLALKDITVVLSSPALSEPRSEETDEKGRYRFEGLPEGSYSLVFSTYLGRDAIARHDCVAVTGGTTQSLRARVDAPIPPPELQVCPVPPRWPASGSQIAGTVRVRGKGALPSVTIVARRTDCRGGGAFDWPDAGGAYVLKDLLPGPYQVEFVFGDHLEKTQVVVGSGVLRLDHELEPEPVRAEIEFQDRVRRCECR